MPGIPARGERLGDHLGDHQWDERTRVYAHAERLGYDLTPPNGITLVEHLLGLKAKMTRDALFKRNVYTLQRGDHVRYYDVGGLCLRAILYDVSSESSARFTLLWHQDQEIPEPMRDRIGAIHQAYAFEIEPIHPLELLADEG